VTLVGFGNIGPNVSSGGRKHMVEVNINQLITGGAEINIGNSTMGGCNGDSGGPAYIKMPDGTWRAFGITSRSGPGGPNCRGTGIWGVTSFHVDWIERESGLDITPCHGPGGWEGGPNCDRFPTDPGGRNNGTWAEMCGATPVAKPAVTCLRGGMSPPNTDAGSSPTTPDARPDVLREAGPTAPPDAAPARPDAEPPVDLAMAMPDAKAPASPDTSDASTRPSPPASDANKPNSGGAGGAGNFANPPTISGGCAAVPGRGGLNESYGFLIMSLLLAARRRMRR
jgi:hypothetical protein